MSTTLTKRSLRHALADAEAFKDLFAGTYERWEIAGSCRRGKAEVGDVEHVIIPRWGFVQGDDLFATPSRRNLLLARAEVLLFDRAYVKHVYGQTECGAPRYKWGDTHRGMDFRGFNHELFGADVENWGSVLAIRTGPADYSPMLMAMLKRNGYRNHLGRVWKCAVCPLRIERVGQKCADDCELCQGTQLHPMSIVPVPSERHFFAVAGVAWAEPGERR